MRRTITLGRFVVWLCGMLGVVLWLGMFAVVGVAAHERVKSAHRGSPAPAYLESLRDSERVPIALITTPAPPFSQPWAVPGPSPSAWEWYTVTGYGHGCACDRLVVVAGRTRCDHRRGARKAANGRWPLPRFTAAASPLHPFGAVLEFKFRESDEFAFTRVVGDRGSAIQGRSVDLFEGTCAAAEEWERRRLLVRVVSR